jgi:hypothetical protein
MLRYLLPLLLLLVCPLGMATMMLAPAPLRRFRPSTANHVGTMKADPSVSATTTRTGIRTGLAGSVSSPHR